MISGTLKKSLVFADHIPVAWKVEIGSWGMAVPNSTSVRKAISKTYDGKYLNRAWTLFSHTTVHV